MAESKNTTAKQAADTSADAAETDTQLAKQEKTELKPTPERKPAGRKPTPERKPGGRKPAGEGILPKKASEDDTRRWGDESGYDHDAWLKEQRPPHWG